MNPPRSPSAKPRWTYLVSDPIETPPAYCSSSSASRPVSASFWHAITTRRSRANSANSVTAVPTSRSNVGSEPIGRSTRTSAVPAPGRELVDLAETREAFLQRLQHCRRADEPPAVADPLEVPTPLLDDLQRLGEDHHRPLGQQVQVAHRAGVGLRRLGRRGYDLDRVDRPVGAHGVQIDLGDPVDLVAEKVQPHGCGPAALVAVLGRDDEGPAGREDVDDPPADREVARFLDRLGPLIPGLREPLDQRPGLDRIPPRDPPAQRPRAARASGRAASTQRSGRRPPGRHQAAAPRPPGPPRSAGRIARGWSRTRPAAPRAPAGAASADPPTRARRRSRRRRRGGPRPAPPAGRSTRRARPPASRSKNRSPRSPRPDGRRAGSPRPAAIQGP